MRPVESIIFTENELRQIAVKVAAALRNHPEVEGGVSVRATMSFLEVLKALKLMEETISIQTIYDTAFSTFGGRIRSRDWIKTEDIVHEVLDKILCEVMNKKITSVEETNILSERTRANSVLDRRRAPTSAMFQVGKEELKKLFKNYYRELIGSPSNNILEKINREELERLLNELEAMLDLIQSSNIVYALESNKHWYRKEFPTLFRAMRKLAPIVSNHNNYELSGINSTIPETINTLFEALEKAKYLEREGNDLYLSFKAYDLVFKDVLPQVEKIFIKGEHEAVTLGDNRGEGEIFDIRKYNRSDRF
ncbi:MAG: hypothetical protein JSV20_04105 [Candidatus Bathyarchaeota archaeon]|nr:MAG: hypothetical protein JSV20_04105 [Candidatus Bathyarchaeota archaeon]